MLIFFGVMVTTILLDLVGGSGFLWVVCWWLFMGYNGSDCSSSGGLVGDGTDGGDGIVDLICWFFFRDFVGSCW